MLKIILIIFVLNFLSMTNILNAKEIDGTSLLEKCNKVYEIKDKKLHLKKI